MLAHVRSKEVPSFTVSLRQESSQCPRIMKNAGRGKVHRAQAVQESRCRVWKSRPTLERSSCICAVSTFHESQLEGQPRQEGILTRRHILDPKFDGHGVCSFEKIAHRAKVPPHYTHSSTWV